MNKLNNLLEGRMVLAEVESEANGTLTVIRDFVFGTYIRGGGLPQSGGLAELIWKETLSKIKTTKQKTEKCLIVGLGGGSIAKLVRKNWSEAKINGVDIDPVIVELGKKYMGLEKSNVDIKIEDGEKYINELIADKKTFDLICFDTYVGENFPQKFESLQFIKEVKKLLTGDGLVVFNRLYGPEDRAAALAFAKTLEKVFTKVERVYPEANIMFVCRS